MTASGATIAAVLTGSVFAAPLWLRILGPARVALRYAERLVTHGATFHALADLRVWFFRNLAARTSGGLGFRQAGDVLSRLVGDIEALDGLYLRILVPLAGAALLVPVAGLVAGRSSPILGVFVFLMFWLAAFMLPLLAAGATLSAGGRLARTSSALRIVVLDMLTGLREVRAFGAEGRMLAVAGVAEQAMMAAQRALARNTAFANAASLLCGQFALLAVLACMPVSPVMLAVTIFLLVATNEATAGLARAGVGAGTAAAAAQRVLEVARAPLLPEPATPRTVPANPGLRFAGVHFRWDMQDAQAQPVFDGLTLEVPYGGRVAVLGPSGAGKSTLALLAMKVERPQSGKIFLGGLDLADIPTAEVHRQIAWLSQATHLFDDTIRANLLLGRPEATERDLWDALDRAAIGAVVRALPDQLDTWLGEGGARLSGGQGRRIALARTLLSTAPILILDEPCAGLDPETERAFFSTLFAEIGARTVILIAHRLTGAEKLDRIWRLSAGHAVAAAA
jgi:ATP-binding cassette subfamily C protein CydC